MNRFARTTLVLLVVALLAACGGNGGSSSSPAGSGAGASGTTSGRAITDINNVSQLRDAFNQHPGQPRLIVLMSPT